MPNIAHYKNIVIESNRFHDEARDLVVPRALWIDAPDLYGRPPSWSHPRIRDKDHPERAATGKSIII